MDAGVVDELAQMDLTFVLQYYDHHLVSRSCRKLSQTFALPVKHSAQAAEARSERRILTISITGPFDGESDKIQAYARNLFDPEVQTSVPCCPKILQLFIIGRWAESFENKFDCPVDISCNQSGLVISTPSAEANVLVHSAIEELIAAAESQRQIIEGRQDGDDWVICRAFEDAFRHTFSSNNLTSYKQLRPEAQFVLLKWIHWLIHFPDPTIQALRQNYSPPDLIDFSIELEEAQSSCLGTTVSLSKLSLTPKPIPFVPSSLNLRIGLRPIIIDAANVAMKHGSQLSVHSYSYEGIYRCAHFWMDRGHTVVVILRTISEKRFPIHGWEYLEELEKIAKTDKSLCVIVRQKVRRIQETDENGERRPKYYKPYDDYSIMQHAESQHGAVVSNDRYQDLLEQKPQWRKIIKERVVQFRFDRNKFIPFVAKWAAMRRGTKVSWEEIVHLEPGEEIPSLFREAPPPPPGYQNPMPFNPRVQNRSVSLL